MQLCSSKAVKFFMAMLGCYWVFSTSWLRHFKMPETKCNILLFAQLVDSTWLGTALLFTTHSFTHRTTTYWTSTMKQALCFEFFPWCPHWYTQSKQPRHIQFSTCLPSKGLLRLQQSLWIYKFPVYIYANQGGLTCGGQLLMYGTSHSLVELDVRWCMGW
jgi:hypothetical protein